MIDENDLGRRFTAMVQRIGREGLSPDIAELALEIDEVTSPALRGELAKLLGFYWLRQGDYVRARDWSDRASTDLLDDPDCAYNAMFAACQMARWDETISRAERALERFGERSEFYDILSATFGVTGRMGEARVAGTRALELKSLRVSGPALDLSHVPTPPFDGSRPERNAICFSLFGEDPKYTDGAILNARAAPFLYPGWSARFYVDDSVPRPVIDALSRAGARILMVAGLPSQPFGPLWRFLAADDPGLDRYLLRDADSLVNTRERVAVDEWLRSGTHFHVMRDHYDHCELVLAGMWGAVRGALPPQTTAIQAWAARQNRVLGKTTDQEYLRTHLWPTIRQSVLSHDSQFSFGDGRPFPSVGGMPPGCWVGCQWRQHAAPPSW